MRDGVLKEFTLWEFLRFMLFMPTFSSGPIDRFKRFNEDYKTIPEREELLDMLEQAVKYIMYGFLYKFILAHIFGHLLLGHVQTYALSQGGFFNIGTLGAVSYTHLASSFASMVMVVPVILSSSLTLKASPTAVIL